LTLSKNFTLGVVLTQCLGYTAKKFLD